MSIYIYICYHLFFYYYGCCFCCTFSAHIDVSFFYDDDDDDDGDDDTRSINQSRKEISKLCVCVCVRWCLVGSLGKRERAFTGLWLLLLFV